MNAADRVTIERDEQPQAWTYDRDRASARTEAQREEHYQAWLHKFGKPYSDAVIEGGGTPWFSSETERRDLFMRRYRKPKPPERLSIPRLGAVRHAEPFPTAPVMDDTEETAA